MGRNFFSYSEAFFSNSSYHAQQSFCFEFFCSKDFQFRKFFQKIFPHFFSFKKSKFATEPIEIFFCILKIKLEMLDVLFQNAKEQT